MGHTPEYSVFLSEQALLRRTGAGLGRKDGASTLSRVGRF